MTKSSWKLQINKNNNNNNIIWKKNYYINKSLNKKLLFIYNGKKFIKLKINNNFFNKKIGEFIRTKQKCNHKKKFKKKKKLKNSKR